MILRRLTILSLAVMLLAGCSAKAPDVADLYQDKTATQIFQIGEHLMLKGDYDEAIKHFEVIDVRYPFGKYARQSQLDVIYSYYKQEEDASALAAADRYIRLYPRGPNVDYAYYLRGLVRFNENHTFFDRHFKTDFATRDLTSIRKGFNDFNILVRYFPRSPYAADAHQRMIYIRNALARHEVQVAQFYFYYESYVAAANRANVVVQHYQGTPSVPKALAIMVKSYQKLQLTKEAQSAEKVLRLNFPTYKL